MSSASLLTSVLCSNSFISLKPVSLKFVFWEMLEQARIHLFLVLSFWLFFFSSFCLRISSISLTTLTSSETSPTVFLKMPCSYNFIRCLKFYFKWELTWKYWIVDVRLSLESETNIFGYVTLFCDLEKVIYSIFHKDDGKKL